MIIFPTTDGRKFYQYTPDFRIGRTCVLTKYVKNEFDKEELKGIIDVEYKISMDGMVESQNRLTIEVM